MTDFEAAMRLAQQFDQAERARREEKEARRNNFNRGYVKGQMITLAVIAVGVGVHIVVEKRRAKKNDSKK